MKILYVSASVLPSQTADSVHVMNMSAALAKNGHEVTLFGIEGDDENAFAYYSVDPIFDIKTIPGGKKNIIKRIWNIIRLSKKTDVIYTRYVIGAVLARIFSRKPVIYEYHLVMDRAYNIFLEKLLAKCDNVRHVFITNSLMKKYQEIIPALKKSDCLVLSDCANDPEVEVEEYSSSSLSCGYIGSFLPGKGVEIVVKLAALYPENVFHIIGGKPEEISKLKKQGTDNIIWHGYKKQREAMKLLQDKIDVALLPNQSQVLVASGNKRNADIGCYTSPMKLFEYMSYGKAIIASKLPVLEEIVTDHENALLVECDNIHEWQLAFNELEENSSLFNNIRKKAHDDFLNNYTWSQRARKAVTDFPKKK